MTGRRARILVVGAGMAGIAAHVELRQAGFEDIVLYEKGDCIGGTWRENTYPGVSCDVPSHLYSYSFAPNAEWSHTFAAGPEIRDYLERVAKDRDVEPDIVFGAEVTRLERRHGRWHLTCADGTRDEGDVVIAATGVLHHPSMPDIPGLEDFDGPTFHSARWDHGVALQGTRVGVVGTGSSAVQIVGAVAETVGHLTLFQRTPQWVLAVPNPEIDEEERARMRADPASMTELRSELSRTFLEHFANAVVDASSPQLAVIEDLCRANLEEHVTDAELRERLRPDYRAACKRLVISPNFYEAVQRPNVTLVTDPIAGIESGGVRTTDDLLHELDVLVLATGFRVDRFLRPIEVIGRDGISLEEVWAERPSAYLSVSIPDFPNLFLLNGPNGPVGNFSLIDVVELQLGYLLPLVTCVADEGMEISASRAALDRFEADRVEAAKRTVWVSGCRSWYLDDRGVPSAWPWSMDRFREAMARPDFADYDVVATRHASAHEPRARL